MNTAIECYECIFRQAVTALSGTNLSPESQITTLKKVLKSLQEADSSYTPSAIAGETNRVMRESTGIMDFYQDEKIANHDLALSYLDDLRNLLQKGDDLLKQGLKISASGNIIDIIHGNDYQLWQEVVSTVKGDLIGGGIDQFREALAEAPYLLYLADNVGETVFDRVFIESLDIPVYYAVKSGPILNDATLEDALAAGLDQAAEFIIETGSQSPGTILYQCSEEFQELFQESSLVISKGQANYETMDENGDKVFFLLRAKCPVLSRELGAPIGSLVFKQGRPLQDE
jgi:uncharacterized protein with ATP-grasp and redox domains